MRIYRMRATFGKLENRELELKPGLNIIEAPNEWGKSTWCAFLVAMLYGIETRARTTQAALAEKEKYAPWSGSPMEGRIDLNWNGRDITIERRSKGRTPFGVFKAYETATGMEVPELTGANCGQLLLGVEKSVFAKTGFLRLNELPVTQDEALRRRLNALVTTGDESGAGDMLGAKLKELKNACRYNRSGLLPKAEAELAMLEEKQRELARLNQEIEGNVLRQRQTEDDLLRLKNHQAALRYQSALADQARVAAAENAFEEAAARRDRIEAVCAGLPGRDEIDDKRRRLAELQQQWLEVQSEARAFPAEPEEPKAPAAFANLTADELLKKVKTDAGEYGQLREKMEKKPVPGWILLGLGLVAAAVLAALELWIPAAMAALMLVGGALLLLRDRKERSAATAAMERIAGQYPWREPEQWIQEAVDYVNRLSRYTENLAQRRAAMEVLAQRRTAVQEQITQLTQGQGVSDMLQEFRRMNDAWNELEDARGDLKQAEHYLHQIRAMAKTAQPPEFEDSLMLSEPETNRLVAEYTARQSQLLQQLGKLRGAMTAIGDEQLLQSQIQTLQKRIAQLEETAAALDLAQQTLAAAIEQLQRRFAPRITERARCLFARLTDGRYDRLNLTRELAVDTAAAGEMTMHSAQWRSEGTVDQLYIALRLAVAEELTPEAPLVLDDALVRFDDRRLANALSVLEDAAVTKQVILFTCQKREGELCPEARK